MTAGEIVTGKLDIGRVIRRTFEVLGRNAALYFGLAFLFGAVPGVISGLLTVDRITAGGVIFTSPLYYVQIVVLLFFSSFVAATAYDLALADLRGTPRSIGEAIRNGLKLFLPLFAVNLLLYLACFVGFLLLVVPGFMILTAWCVAGPALIDERTGITQSFGRSGQLTRNNRWRIFGLMVLVIVAAMIIEGVVAALGFATGFGAGALLFSVPRMIGTAIINTLFTAVSLVGLAVLYAELRDLKQGVGAESLSEVFD
jgi:hypothetical protein